MAHYIELNAAEFEAFLQAEGFGRTVQHSEVVYTREHNKSGIVIKCYTSIQDGDSVGRDCGKDAVRLCAVAYRQGKGYPIFKAKRCHRSGSQQAVHARVKDRIEEAIVRCDAWLAEQAAKHVPAPIAKTLPQSNRPSPTTGAYYGSLREHVRITVEVMDHKELPNGKHLFTMQMGRNTFTYTTELNRLCVGEMYDISAMICGYKTVGCERQTELRDVKGKRVVQ